MTQVLTWPVGRAAHGEDVVADRPPGLPVLAYLAGAATGGALMALAIAAPLALLLGDRQAGWVAAATLAICSVAVVLQWRGVTTRLPQRRKQVPRRWLLWQRRELTAAAYGLVIGTGVLTYFEYAAVYIVLVYIATTQTIWGAVLLGGVYGTTRGMTLVVTWIVNRTGRDIDWQALVRHRSTVHRAVGALAFASVSATFATGYFAL